MEHASLLVKLRTTCLLMAVLPAPLWADVQGPGGKTIDCYCTDTSGARVELGETICLDVDGRLFLAQCQMSLNVPMWREVQDGCLSSGISAPSHANSYAKEHPKVLFQRLRALSKG